MRHHLLAVSHQDNFVNGGVIPTPHDTIIDGRNGDARSRFVRVTIHSAANSRESETFYPQLICCLLYTSDAADE